MSPTRLFVSILSMGIAPFALAQATSGYPICYGGTLLVGEAPNNPFHAQIVEDSWKTAPDGTKTQVDLPKKESAYYVARDSKGRVVIRSKFTGTLRPSSGEEGQATSWTDTICDPTENTVTKFTYQDVFYHAVDPTGQSFYASAGKAGHAYPSLQTDKRTTDTFRFYHKKINGREDLGSEIFSGVPAYRYRFLKTPQHDPVLHELVISEDLEAFLAQINWNEDRTAEREIRLIHIYRVEPISSDFDPPQGVMFDRIRVMPATRIP